jgi:Rrf2 family iron-sulfur cluster assembly transcriptional regulator
MQLSTKGRYAVMAMTELARREGARATPLAQIAQRQQISQAYLEQLFARLRRRGLVLSVRGPGGGYRLARPASELSVADVVTAVDEPLRATRCAGEGVGCMRGGVRCLTHDLWEETGRQIEDYLASVSLADVLAGRLRRDTARAA